MDQLEKVEQLVDKAGCTYKEAKEALEAADWNLLDAMIALEQSGKAVKSSASASRAGGSPAGERSAQAREGRQEPPRQEAPRHVEEPEVISAEDAEKIRPEGFGDSGKGGYRNASSGGGSSQTKMKGEGLFVRLKNFFTRNYISVIGRAQNQIARIPLWIAAIAVLIWFWMVLICAGLWMLFGGSFHFEGEDFGRININDTVDKAASATYSAGQRMKENFSGKDGRQ